MLSYFCLLPWQPYFSFSIHFTWFQCILGCVKLFQRLLPTDQPIKWLSVYWTIQFTKSTCFQQFKLSVLYLIGICLKLWTDCHEADRNAKSTHQRQLNMVKISFFFTMEDQSLHLKFDCPMHYPLFWHVTLPASSHLLMFVNANVVILLFSF